MSSVAAIQKTRTISSEDARVLALTRYDVDDHVNCLIADNPAPITPSIQSNFHHFTKGNVAMVRLAILDQDGKHLTLEDVPTAKELFALVEQARSVMRDGERLAQQIGAKSGASQPQGIPYMS